MNEKTKIVVAFIGGIGAGKTAAARHFLKKGAAVIDADRIGHELLADPEIRRTLAGRFGTGILAGDGTIDRARLAAAAFTSEDSLRLLDEIVHPRLIGEIRKRVTEIGEGVVVIDAALLIEFELDRLCDVIVMIETDRALRNERIGRERGWPEGEITRREAHQLPVFEKGRVATDVIKNNGSSEDFWVQLDRLWEKLRQVQKRKIKS